MVLLKHQRIAACFFIVLSALWQPYVQAQQPIDTAKANRLVEQASNLSTQAQYDSALVLYDKAIKMYKKAGMWKEAAHNLISRGYALRVTGKYHASMQTALEGWEIASEQLETPNVEQARACHYIGSAYILLAEYDNATEWLYRGLNIARDNLSAHSLIGAFYLALGNVYDSQGRYNEALEIYEDGIDQLSTIDTFLAQQNLGFIYNNMGVAYRKQGKYRQALNYYQKTLDQYMKVYGGDHPNVAETYNNIGLVYQSMGDVGEALPYYEKSLRIIKEVHGEEHPLIAALYNNMSVVNREQGKLKQALEYSHKSMDIKRRLLGDDHPQVATSYMNLGTIYRKQKQYSKSLEYYQKALDIRQKVFDGDNPALASTYTQMGRVQVQMDHYEQALDSFNEGLKIALRQLPANHPTVAELYYRRGDLMARQNHYAEALKSYQDGLKGLLPEYRAQSIYDTPPLPGGYPDPTLLDLMTGRAQALKSRYLLTRDNSDLESALATFEQAVHLVDHMQQIYRSEESKFLLNQSTQHLYEQGLQTAQSLYQSTSDQRYLHEAFWFAEKSKARILKELMTQQLANRLADVPDSLVKSGKQLKQRLSFYRRQIVEAQVSDSSEVTVQVDVLRDSLFKLNRRLNQHLSAIETKYPRYYQVQYATSAVSVPKIRDRLLNPDEALVQFLVGDKNTYALVTAQNLSLQLITLPTDSSLQQQISTMRSAISEEHPAKFAQISPQLYQQLIAPVSAAVGDRDLLIVPDGPLFYLPFEALLTESPTSTSGFKWRDGSYLVQERSIRYAPSASLLNMIYEYNQPSGEGLLALAPVFDEQQPSGTNNGRPLINKKLTPLPLSRYEVNTIADIFHQKTSLLGLFGGKEADVLLESQASEKKLKQLSLDHYRYLHFATHAYVDEQHPELSGIILAHDQRDDTEDGQLHTGELYNLKLSSELVVLSACQTALGSHRSGEGLVGLVQPFFYAGTSSLIVSLWNVADRPTADLMINFYKLLLDGNPHSQALRQAKLQLLQTPGRASPLYWASFVQIGQ